jgi:hypothetical protein
MTWERTKSRTRTMKIVTEQVEIAQIETPLGLSNGRSIGFAKTGGFANACGVRNDQNLSGSKSPPGHLLPHKEFGVKEPFT